MKNSQVIVLFGLCFLGLLQIPSSNAKFDKSDPTHNVNLTPFIQSLSAYYCLHNDSFKCSGNFNLTEAGWLNITESETKAFCEGGCFQHTHEILTCVWYVYKGYRFQNGATIKNLRDTIDIGCHEGFNGTSLYPSSGTTTSISATLYALVFFVLYFM